MSETLAVGIFCLDCLYEILWLIFLMEVALLDASYSVPAPPENAAKLKLL